MGLEGAREQRGEQPHAGIQAETIQIEALGSSERDAHCPGQVNAGY